VQETDMFTKTRRECIPAGSVAASLLLTVFLNHVCLLHQAFPYWAGRSGVEQLVRQTEFR